MLESVCTDTRTICFVLLVAMPNIMSAFYDFKE